MDDGAVHRLMRWGYRIGGKVDQASKKDSPMNLGVLARRQTGLPRPMPVRRARTDEMRIATTDEGAMKKSELANSAMDPVFSGGALKNADAKTVEHARSEAAYRYRCRGALLLVAVVSFGLAGYLQSCAVLREWAIRDPRQALFCAVVILGVVGAPMLRLRARMRRLDWLAADGERDVWALSRVRPGLLPYLEHVRALQRHLTVGEYREMIAWARAEEVATDRDLHDVLGWTAGGVYKRIDENRELLELIQQKAPELIRDNPWLEGWLQSQDEFLVSLADSFSPQHARYMHAVRLGKFPRPWPGAQRATLARTSR